MTEHTPEQLTEQEKAVIALLAQAYNASLHLPLMFFDDPRVFSDGVNALMDQIYARVGRRSAGFFQPVRRDQRLTREQWEDWLAHNHMQPYMAELDPNVTLEVPMVGFFQENPGHPQRIRWEVGSEEADGSGRFFVLEIDQATGLTNEIYSGTGLPGRDEAYRIAGENTRKAEESTLTGGWRNGD